MFKEKVSNEMLKSILPTGKENAISSTDLQSILGVSDKREFQKMIENERKQGSMICASNNGYYLPRDRVELLEYYNKAKKDTVKRLSILKPMREYLKGIEGQTELKG